MNNEIKSVALIRGDHNNSDFVRIKIRTGEVEISFDMDGNVLVDGISHTGNPSLKSDTIVREKIRELERLVDSNTIFITELLDKTSFLEVNMAGQSAKINKLLKKQSN